MLQVMPASVSFKEFQEQRNWTDVMDRQFFFSNLQKVILYVKGTEDCILLLQ